MSKPAKIPARVRAVVDRCRDGQTLCKFLRQSRDHDGETEVVFFFEPSGKKCGPKSAAAAIHAGLLKPSGDGLFGDESSQTFVAAS